MEYVADKDNYKKSLKKHKRKVGEWGPHEISGALCGISVVASTRRALFCCL